RPYAGVAQPDPELGVPGLERQPGEPRYATRADARPHPDGRAALPRPDPRLGRGQRGAERRRHAAPHALAHDHRRGLPRPGVPVRPRGRSRGGAVLHDYALENAPKRRGALHLVERLQAQGAPVAGVGLQSHNRMDWPTPAQQDSTIVAFAALGVRVMITELDIDLLPRPGGPPGDLNPYRDGLPDSVQGALA